MKRCLLLLISLTFLMVSCQSPSVTELGEDKGVDRIKESYDDRLWDDTSKNIQEYISRFPYSRRLNEVYLLRANANYDAKSYADAIVDYEEFIRKFPTDKKIPYAYFRIGESYYTQSPGDIDREQANSRSAVQAFDKYMNLFPGDENWDRAKKLRDQLNYRIALQDDFIADFYLRRDNCSAVIYRSQDILREYTQYSDLVKVSKKRISDCYFQLADDLENGDIKDDFSLFTKGQTPQGLRDLAKSFSQ